MLTSSECFSVFGFLGSVIDNRRTVGTTAKFSTSVNDRECGLPLLSAVESFLGASSSPERVPSALRFQALNDAVTSRAAWIPLSMAPWTEATLPGLPWTPTASPAKNRVSATGRPSTSRASGTVSSGNAE